MDEQKKTVLAETIKAMQGILTVMNRKLKAGKPIDFEASQKVFFDFIGLVHQDKLQSLLDELQTDSEDARQKLIEYLKSVPKPAGIEEPKLETEKPGAAKTEPDAGKPEGAEETLLDVESIGKVFDNAMGYVTGIFGELRSQSQVARDKAGELADDVTKAVKPTINDLAKKGGELWDAVTGIGKDLVKKKAFTPEFTSRVHEELRKRGWKDEGIDVALAVFFQVLADMDKKNDEK